MNHFNQKATVLISLRSFAESMSSFSQLYDDDFRRLEEFVLFVERSEDETDLASVAE